MFVFRTVSLLLFLKCLVTSTYSEAPAKDILKPIDISDGHEENITKTVTSSIKSSNPNVTLTKSDEKLKSTQNKNLPSIITEGGDTLRTAVTTQNTSTSNNKTAHSDVDNNNINTSTVRTYGREGEITDSNFSLINTTNTHTEKKENVNKTNIATFDTVKPITEPTIMDIQPVKKIHNTVPKKQAEFNARNNNFVTNKTDNSTIVVNENSLATMNTTELQLTTTVKPIHKPTVTIGSEEDSDALAKDKLKNSTPKVPTIEFYQKNKDDNKRSAFIIPIVAVILSVPLVAIILNILYKRGKEWWSHRHYSRMDFLIDGMYNN